MDDIKIEELCSLNDIYNKIPTGIAFCDENGKVIECNPSYLNILGIKKEDILGYDIFDNYNFTDETIDKIKHCESYEYSELYTMPKDIFKDSSVDTISIDVKIVRKTKDDKTSGYVVYIANHTEQWEAYEKQLSNQEKRYHDLIDNLPLDYTHSKLIFDENGQIVDYLNMSGNKQCEEFYIKHNMAWGKTLATKFLPITGDFIIGKLNEIRNSGKSGGHFFYDIKEIGEIDEMVAVFENDEWVNLISMPVTTIEQARILAEEKLKNEQDAHNRDLEESMKKIEAANAAKTNFLFNMSHDIRTPMNAIIGFTDILERHQDDPVKRQDSIDKIRNASDTLLDLINNVLEMSSIESGNVKFEEKPNSTRNIYENIVSVFSSMMTNKDIKFTSKIDIKHEYAYFDSTVMEKIFINLLSNAYKYTNNGGNIEFLVKEIGYDDKYVTYQAIVKDNGVGMSEEFQKHMFEEFSREHTTTESEVEGTGLGMAIVKKCVDLMHGEIKTDSALNKGSCFTVTLSHKLASKEDVANLKKVSVDIEQFKGKKILLVEDNDLNAEITIEILKEANFVVDRVFNGQECIDILKNNDYDAILMDIQMPIKNGYEATKEIRKLSDKKKASIPILAMTANAFKKDINDAINAGMNGHIAKPIDVNKLFEELSRVLYE